jgi:hypothetical protein
LLNVTLSCNQNDGTRNSSNNVVDLGERADVIRSRRQHNLWCLKTRCKAGNVCWCCIFEKQFSDQEVECYLDKKKHVIKIAGVFVAQGVLESNKEFSP